MIQEIAPHIFHNEYLPQPPQPDSFVLSYSGKNALLAHREDGTIEFPTFRELQDENPDIFQEYTYLFSVDGHSFYLVPPFQAPERFSMENTQIFRGAQPRWLAFAGITGWQLSRWYDSRRFCGHCGSPLSKSDKERMLYCESCHQMEYPKISPAVIIGVTHGNRLLLSRYAGRAYQKYALLAGFTEIGETLEETVRREVMEEVGLKVKNIRYYKNQPWSFTDTLLVGFFCDLDDSEEVHLDKNELACAEWFERGDIPVEDNTAASLTYDMICAFRDGKV